MSGIEWTTETWNAVVGCSRVSAGCENCYAEQDAGRVMCAGIEQYDGVVDKPDGVDEWRWTGRVNYAEHRLRKPLDWDKPRRIFVDSMSDLFHPEVDFEYIAAVFGIMQIAQRHTFQVLTKRPERMLEFFEWVEQRGEASGEGVQAVPGGEMFQAHSGFYDPSMDGLTASEPRIEGDFLPDNINGERADDWPLPNVWLGVSTEDQEAADARIPPLLDCPAAVRFVSAEPLLGAIDFRAVDCGDAPPGDGHDVLEGAKWEVQGPNEVGGSSSRVVYEDTSALDLIIVGGESGADARPCDIDWIRSIRDQCEAAGVPVFVKQLGSKPAMNEYDPDGSERLVPLSPDGWGCAYDDDKGGDPDEWPEGLRVQELPEGADRD